MFMSPDSRLSSRAGVLWGLAISSLTGAQLVLALAGVGAATLQALGQLVWLGGFAAFFLLGYLVRRRVGSVAAGVRVGLEAAVVASLGACLLAVVVAIIAPAQYDVFAAQMTSASVGVGAALVVGLLTFLAQAATGVGLAAAGALASRPQTATPGR